jgi:enamine deaminase RidA (YjgF/YER057c/UK114 family)
MKFLHPEGWAQAKGYNNGAIATGDCIFVGGQIGWNKDQVFESDDFVVQVKQALQNIVAIISEAGASPTDIIRLTWFITDKNQYKLRQKDIGKVYREVMGRHFPPMSVVQVVALIEDEAKVEIEATAIV